MKKFLIGVLAIAMLACAACSDSKKNDPVPSESVVETIGVETFSIETEFCTIRFPKEWENMAQVEVDSRGIYMIAKLDNALVPLFELTFDTEIGKRVGTLKTDEEHKVYLNTFTVTDSHLSEQSYQDCIAMQEAVSVLLDALEEDYDFSPTGKRNSGVRGTFERR